MKLGIGFRFYIVYFLIIGGLSWLIVLKAFEGVDESTKRAAEEVLVDSANVLAEMVTMQVNGDQIEIEPVAKLIDQYLVRRLDANIYTQFKASPDLHLYITNKQGIVLYDSTGKSTGEDFSRWRDVSLTLQGLYGARSSAFNPSIENPTPEERALYVAAPIYSQEREIVGVLTVFKPVTSLGDYTQEQMQQIRQYTWAVLVIALIFGAAMTWLLGRAVARLVDYADMLAQGKKAPAPKMQQRDLQILANSISHMREELDGKSYVEDYIHTLTHELKTPITGIQSAAELLQEPLPEDKKQHFATHILNASERMTLLIERLLKLAALEKQTNLSSLEAINLAEMIHRVVMSRDIQLQSKTVTVDMGLDKHLMIEGDGLLIEQAFANVLDNAIDFTPVQSTISVQLRQQAESILLVVTDQGSGFADYAKGRVFERFYSTARPDTEQRSTGLGLSFVREIMNLHRGEVIIGNSDAGGAEVCLVFKG